MGKRLIIGFITAATNLVLFTAAAPAAEQNVLIDHQPTRRGGPAADTEFLDMFGFPFSNFEADNFVLASPAAITRINAWGFHDLDNPPATETMRIRFYDSRPGDGLPGGVLYEETFSNFTRIATGQIVFTGVDPHEYFYTFDLASPVALASTTLYWLELVQVGDLQTAFRWELSSGGDRSRVFRNPSFPDWTVASGSDLAFQLIAVPEPASLSFMALLIIRAVTGRRRSGTRMK